MRLAPVPLLGLLSCAVATALACPLAASAAGASLKVSVVDSLGHPLPDAVVLLEPATGRLPVKPMAQIDIAQNQRQFSPQLTVITTGTPVNFPNFDTVRHQVYSFSPIKSFELKLYTGVPNAPVVFDKPGVAVLGCNIHDGMTAWVVVVDTPHHARTPTSGEVRIEGIAPGAYRLRAWHANVPEGAAPAPQNLTFNHGDLTARIQLPAAIP
jgi:plastocyanin